MPPTESVQLLPHNIKNDSLTLSANALSLFPQDAIGGSSKTAAGNPIVVRFDGTNEEVDTDIDGKKKILRARPPVRRFYEHHQLTAGDWVAVERIQPRVFCLRSASFGARRKTSGRQRPSETTVPLEQGEVDGYEVITKAVVLAARRREARLVRAYADHLEAAGDVVSRTKVMPIDSTHPLYTDVFNTTRNQLIEAKAGNSRSEIRMAIGQLADYGRCLSADARRAVLVEEKPDRDLLDLLERESIAVIWRRANGFADSHGGRFT